jgi:hypothetical protein
MDSKNKRVTDVALSVTESSGYRSDTKADQNDADGQFSVKDLAAGTYRVMSIAINGFVSADGGA